MSKSSTSPNRRPPAPKDVIKTAPAAKPDKPALEPLETLHGSSTLASTYEIGDETVQLGTLVAAAHQASGLTGDAWNALPDAERDALIGAELQRRQDAVPPKGTDGDASRPSDAGESVAPSPAAQINLLNLQSHPLAARFSELMAELEKLPGDPRQTALVIRVSELRQATQDLINGVAPSPTPAAMPAIAEVPAAGTTRIKVIGPKESRWRAGLQFTAEPRIIDATPEQLEAIKADPRLSHEVVPTN